jgi:hypothetical protein
MADCFPTISDGQDGGEIMSSLSRTFGVLALASTAWFGGEAAAQTTAATIDQIRSSKTLRIAYDPDAPPFSYIVPGSPATAAPQGYSVDLCRAVVDQFKDQLKIPDLKVAYVVVNSVTRFDAVADNKADLLCEASTATLSRRARSISPSRSSSMVPASPSVPTARVTSSSWPARRSPCCPGRRPSRNCAAPSPAPRSMPRSCWSKPTRKASTWSRKARSRPISPTGPR